MSPRRSRRLTIGCPKSSTSPKPARRSQRRCSFGPCENDRQVISDVVATPTAFPRRSQRLKTWKTDKSERCSPGVGQIARGTVDFPKPSRMPPRGSRRLTIGCPKSSTSPKPARRSQRRCSFGPCENDHQVISDVVATPTAFLRRSQRLTTWKTDKSERCFPAGALKMSQNTLKTPKVITGQHTITGTVLRRSQRLLQSKTSKTNCCSFDGNTRQDFDLPKVSVQKNRNSISRAKQEVVAKLNFGDVQIAKCNEAIGNTGGSLERRVTRYVHSSVADKNRGGKPELRVVYNDVGVGRGRDSKSLLSMAVNSGNSIQKNNDVSKRCIGASKENHGKSDSNLVSGQKKRCLRQIPNGNKEAGVKRKQKEMNDAAQGTDHGWTKEQEKALQIAYFAAKPTPNFWKKVSKSVPGKSAQECYDKYDSESLSPSVPQTRLRSKPKTSSPQLEISILETEPKRKRVCRRKSHVNQKIARKLMRKQSHVELDNKADFFRVLEPLVNPLPEALPTSPVPSTPSGITGKGSSWSSRSWSLSSQKKSKSRFSGKSEIPIASPPVLKPVKNMALHDKYVDQLHAREAKRKLASKVFNRRTALLHQGDVTQPLVKNKDVVRVAKESLISDARDAINKFRHSEIHMDSCYDSEEAYDDEDDEEEENTL